MSLFAAKCIRCGERTRQTYQDKPTCDRCRDELELALAESVEEKRVCPADGATLKKEIVHGVIIDRCATCRGVWLDPGELERVSQEVADEVWKAMAYGRPMG
jgi:hypothetical protein